MLRLIDNKTDLSTVDEESRKLSAYKIAMRLRDVTPTMKNTISLN